MTIKFKSKERSTRFKDYSTEELAEFLMTNNKYFELAFSILSVRRHKISNNMEKIIENDLKCCDDLKEDEHYIQFVNLMSMFYNTDKDTLNNRRGALLERIMGNITPYKGNSVNFHKIEEALVYWKESLLSEKDIDLVLEFGDSELYECKATLKNFLREPIEDNSIDKLKLMDKTKTLCESMNKNCDIYLATYNDSIERYIDRLKKHSFFNFKVFSGKMIFQNLNI